MKAVVHAEKGPFRLVVLHTASQNDVPVVTWMCDLGAFNIGIISPQRPLTPLGRRVRPGIRYRKHRVNGTPHDQHSLFIHFWRRTLWLDYLRKKKVTS